MPTDYEVRSKDRADVELWCEALSRYRAKRLPTVEMLQFLSDPAIVGHLAVDASLEVVGWSWGHVHRHVEGFLQGQLYGIEVSPSHRRAGLGLALAEAMKSSFIEAGATKMWLFTDEDNTPAKALYELTGGVASPHDDATYWWQF